MVFRKSSVVGIETCIEDFVHRDVRIAIKDGRRKLCSDLDRAKTVL